MLGVTNLEISRVFASDVAKFADIQELINPNRSRGRTCPCPACIRRDKKRTPAEAGVLNYNRVWLRPEA